ncbi:MAG: acetyl-CoA acetyltransferase [Gammaproteobacteria bacterium]
MSADQPILVGVSQMTIRPDEPTRPKSAVDFMADCARLAVEDAGVSGLLEKVDALHVVNIFSRPTPNPPAELSEALGIRPGLMEYTAIGGNSPQWLINRAADNLAGGRTRVSLLTGCEVMYTAARSGEGMIDPVSAIAALETGMVGDDRFGSHRIEMDHFADLPVRVYPILENALRAGSGMSLDEHRRVLGRFAEDFSKVAALNPYAWFPTERSAAEAVTVSADNRMISFPYTKYLNAVINVDQAAAVILTTTRVARELAIPEDRWVYLHGGQDAHDIWYVSHRPDLAESPAIKACVEDALDQAGIGVEQVSLFDLYSCFPCMPELARKMIGLSADDPRPITITGGLPYFGGPGSNYSMHAIAEAAVRCREDRDRYVLVTANGWYCTKHSAGIYGGRPPGRSWSRTPPDRFQAGLRLPAPLEIDPEPAGMLVVDGYTVWHDREGQPDIGIVCGKTTDGKRAWAQTPAGDADVLLAMMTEEWVGKAGRIRERDGRINRIEF